MNLCTSCGCGSEEKSPAVPSKTVALAIATIPIQPWVQPYDPATALNHGTIFPNLDLPFYATGGER